MIPEWTTTPALEIERAMRGILKLFAEGRLLYWSREARCVFDVAERARRARRVREGRRV